MTRDTVWFSSAAEWATTPGSRPVDAPTIRRDAAMAPGERTLTERVDWVHALREVDGLPTDDVDAYRLAYDSLLTDEPDLADPVPVLTGDAVCALLGIEPGRDVGVALQWLRDLRLEEGPMDPTVAADRLSAWWPTRPVDG